MREKEFLPAVKERLGIEKLNEMQVQMMSASSEQRDIILLSPTGSGKTLAFVLPLMKILRPSTGRVQGVIVAPSRELVIQVAGIVNAVSPGFKVTALYGGHNVEDEVKSLGAGTDIIVATPGRLLDHINRRNIDLLPCRVLILDEFDKSLELGFEKEMKKIVDRLKNVSRYILTSATKAEYIPDFLKLRDPLCFNYLEENKELKSRIRIHRVDSDENDKLETIDMLLRNISDGGEIKRTIIFVNYRESVERVGEYLNRKGWPVASYHGALDQRERETAVSMFNNGSRPILVATDLASRGLDIEGVKNVIHYHQALTPESYTHRNGRTARVDNSGDVYLLIGPKEDLKDFATVDDSYHMSTDAEMPELPKISTIRISAGKKEKLSKGDILGFLIKEAGASNDDIGKIEVRDHYSLVALNSEVLEKVMSASKGKKIKGEKRLISIIAS